MKKLFSICYIILFIFITVETGDTSIVTFREGDGGSYSTTQCTYLYWHNQSTSYGAADYIRQYSAFGELRAAPLIRFPDIFGTSPGQIPYGATINSATLFFRIKTLYTIHYEDLHHITGEWITGQPDTTWENSVTWNNFTWDYDTTPVSTYRVGGNLNLDVTSSLALWSEQTAINYGWIFMNTTNNNTEFYSDDGSFAFRPLLTVDYTYTNPVPEPLSIVMLAQYITFLGIRKYFS